MPVHDLNFEHHERESASTTTCLPHHHVPLALSLHPIPKATQLTQFRSTRELTVTMRDVIETHERICSRGVDWAHIAPSDIVIIHDHTGGSQGFLLDPESESARRPSARLKRRQDTFSSARLTQDPHGQIPDIRDHLESFVYVYHYIVLGFCLCVPDEGTRRAALLNAIRSVFSRQNKNDDQAANDKLNLICGTQTTILLALRNSTLPQPLRVCLQYIRQLFKAIYQPVLQAIAGDIPVGQPLPDVEFAHSPRGIATFPCEVQDLVHAGELQCTHSALWEVFNKVLQPPYIWPDVADPAVAQFPRSMMNWDPRRRN